MLRLKLIEGAPDVDAYHHVELFKIIQIILKCPCIGKPTV